MDPTRAASAVPAASTAEAATEIPAAGPPHLPGEMAPPPGYDLLDPIGRGGMGVVYRAHDREMNRDVAVKILSDRYPPDAPAAARFVDEARITGRLQHPGIPPVYQVGRLPGGRPFLAMKLVRGETLDALLKDSAPLAPLAVFEAICQAVGYAHAHGVIHRDLKPQNVMVGAFGEVQVMDWGLAKVLASGPRERAVDEFESAALTTADSTYTQYGSVLGTPAYMAPEQAAGETERVDQRTDVFGLGAVLCVLLTGKPPFDGAGPEAVRANAIRGNTAAAFDRLDRCGAEADVVALCKRCLAFDPADRPADADLLAKEVSALRAAADDRARQAELDRATAATRADAARRRRRVVLAAVAGLTVVLTAGVAGTGVGLVRADRARQEAETARREADDRRADAEAARAAEADQRRAAEAKEAEAEAVLGFVQDNVFAAARPAGWGGGLGRDVSLWDALTASVPDLEKTFAGRPLVEARLRLTLGRTYSIAGDDRDAEAQLRRAADLFARTLGPTHPRTLAARHYLAVTLSELANYPEAIRIGEEVAAAEAAALGPDHPDTLATQHGLAHCYAFTGQSERALQLNEHVYARRRATLGPDHPSTLSTANKLANSYGDVGRDADAVTLHEDTPARRRRVHGTDHPETFMSMNNLALAYAAVGRGKEATQLEEACLAGRRRVLGPDHPETLMSLHNLGYTYLQGRRPADALPLFAEAVKFRAIKLGPDHPRTVSSMVGQATALVRLGRGAEAVAVIDLGVDRLSRSRPKSPLLWDLLDLRLRHFQTAKDGPGCRRTAELWEGLKWADAGDLYDSACNRAVAAAAFAASGNRTESAADADRAMTWLTKAVAAGWKDRGHLEADADLAALHDRSDFRALVGSMVYQAPPPRAGN
jgi:tetratricopeptide (TPR) repeat protein